MAISGQDHDLLLQCEDVSKNSHDPDRKVGVVIATPTGHVIAVGTNAPPSSLNLTVAESQRAIRQDPAWKYFMLEHAERNAIFAACHQRELLSGATMYSTLFPCADCARAIVAAKLSRLVIRDLTKDPERDRKWLDHYTYAHRILRMAGVAVEVVEPEESSKSD
jgi:dCMP deaminase